MQFVYVVVFLEQAMGNYIEHIDAVYSRKEDAEAKVQCLKVEPEVYCPACLEMELR